jgi:hypothetical protein
MARGRRSEDTATLEMALIGYQIEKQKIDEKIREIASRLKGEAPQAAAPEKAPGKRRVMSASARRRIAKAQKKRWAEHRKQQAAKQG